MRQRPSFSSARSCFVTERQPQLGVETGLMALDGTFEVMS